MKISLISDLHLAFGLTNLRNDDNCEYLLLAGDIFESKDYLKYNDWLKNVCPKWKRVFLIAGNHEHYGISVQESQTILSSLCIPNLTFMENDVVFLDGIKLIGCTLWTDMNKGCPNTEILISSAMNDYRYIKYHDHKLTPSQTKFMHRESINFIKSELCKEYDGKVIVMTHHSPSLQTISDEYRGSNINGGFCSDLDYLMEDYKIDYWVFGHQHNPSDIIINKTRVVSNPHGYVGYETDIIDTNPLTIELL